MSREDGESDDGGAASPSLLTMEGILPPLSGIGICQLVGQHLRRNKVQLHGTYFFFLVIVNFAPETPRLQPEPVPASASDTSPFVSA